MPSQGLRVGIEAKIEYSPILDILGNQYESIRRTGLSDMQQGMSGYIISEQLLYSS